MPKNLQIFQPENLKQIQRSLFIHFFNKNNNKGRNSCPTIIVSCFQATKPEPVRKQIL